MQKISQDIDQLLAEADTLVQQINAGIIKDMKEVHRLEFEKHAQALKNIKSKVQGKNKQKKISAKDSGAEGMHEAILDIVKAMHNFNR